MTEPATTPGIESLRHVIVVMLENRSFDHLLGYLEHPSSEFDGIGELGRENPWDPEDASKGVVRAVRKRSPRWRVDPDHSHAAIMSQLGVDGSGVAPNSGFVASYEQKASGSGPRPAKQAKLRRTFRTAAGATVAAGFVAEALAGWRFIGGVLGAAGVGGWILGDRMTRPDRFVGDGERIMWCWDPARLPVLSTLALEFTVCTRWFCSVPGETWPNRQFAHAATSAGFHDIEPRLYYDKTIFEVVEDAGREWGIYFDGPPQVMCYPKLWRTSERLDRWHSMQDLFRDIEAGASKLPAYSFVEPNHGYLGTSYSQHPGNNRIANFDVRRADRFVGAVYEALRRNPALFEQTLLVVTWDEHGGSYDHVPPMATILPDDRTRGFDFKISGVRVPTLLISPWIGRHTVDATPYEHASIPRTLRGHFAPGIGKLNDREDAAATFLRTLDLDAPRNGADLPDLSRRARRPRPAFFPIRWLGIARQRRRALVPVDDDQARFDETLARLSAAVDAGIDAPGQPGPVPAAVEVDSFGTELLPPAPSDPAAVAARAEAKLSR